jgi:hypothetical protein
LNSPSKHRIHFALVHARNEKGFVLNGELMFLCKRKTPDTHDKIDDNWYEKHFVEQLFANLLLDIAC